ncbi:MAG: hypothetical protein WBP12_01615 [Candidatus Saccharimonas sp.]
MTILLLGGNSLRHKQWIRDFGAALATHGHEVIMQDYRHWETSDGMADIDHEIAQATEAMQGKDEYAIIAKSIGTIIGAVAVARGLLHPSKVLMLGVPYKGIAGNTPEFAPALTTLPPTVFVQNEHDPYGDSTGLDTLLTNTHPHDYSVVVVPGNNTHDYTDFTQLEQYLA